MTKRVKRKLRPSRSQGSKKAATDRTVKDIEEFQARFVAHDYSLPAGTRPVVTLAAQKALIREFSKESAQNTPLEVLRKAVPHARVKKKGVQIALKVGKDAVEKSLRGIAPKKQG